MIVLNHKKLHTDIVRKLNRLNIPQRQLSEQQGFSRSSLFRIQKGKPIKFELFLILVDWLEVDPNNYLIKDYVGLDGSIKSYKLPDYLKQSTQ